MIGRRRRPSSTRSPRRSGKPKAELAEGGGTARLEEETGDLLFAVANLARHLKIDPELALRKATSKFEKRFHRVEERLRDGGKAPGAATLDEMEAEWQRAKAEGL